MSGNSGYKEVSLRMRWKLLLLAVLVMARGETMNVLGADSGSSRKADVRAWKRALDEAQKQMRARNDKLTAEAFENALKEADAFPAEDIRLTQTLTRYGNWLISADRAMEAQTHLQRAVTEREKARGTNHVEVAACLYWLGQAYLQQEKNEEGQAALERAKWILQQEAGAHHMAVGMVEAELADLYRDIGKYYLSEPLYKSALEKVTSKVYQTMLFPEASGGPSVGLASFTPKPQFEANVRNSLGLLYVNMGDFEKAIGQFKQTLKLWEMEYGKTDLALTTPLVNIAIAYLKFEKHEEAEGHFKRCLTILEKHKIKDHGVLRTTLESLHALATLRNDTESVRLYAQKIAALPRR